MCEPQYMKEAQKTTVKIPNDNHCRKNVCQ